MIRIQTTENCLCNTTGNTKDYTTAGTKSKRHITCFRIKCCKVKTEVIDHTDQFGSRNNDIRIFLSVCIAVRPNGFCFLCSTWHNRNHDGLLSCCMLRITEIFFNYCGHHSLWRSAGRKIRNKFLILVSDEFYPCRTTGCQKRKFFSFFNSIQELRCFFHNGKVSTEACIINFIKSHAMQCIDDFAHYTSAFLEAVMVTNGYTNCRSDLCNHTDFRIRQSLPDFIRIGMNGNRSGRTEYTALATVYALCFCNLFVECRHNHSFCSTECKSKCSDSLNLLAGTYTVSAKDTFIRITYYGW